MGLELKNRAASYLEPILYVGHGLYGLLDQCHAQLIAKTTVDWLFVIVSIAITMNFHALSNLSVIKDRAFAKFWLAWGWLLKFQNP